MSDKLKKGVAVDVSFVGGESPSAAKLGAITAQLANATLQLERAVGDIYGEMHPYSDLYSGWLTPEYGRTAAATPAASAETRALDLVNLGRIIGPASNLNPEMIGQREIIEVVPIGGHEFSLRYPPASSPTPVFSDTTGVFVSVVDKDSLINAGDYHVDDQGRVFTVSVANGGTVTYTVDPDEWSGGTTYLDAGFNVIPDPNQLSAGGSGCTVGAADSQGRRTVSLPTIAHQQINVDRDSSLLDDHDINKGLQLELPVVLTENFTAGELIPAGLVYLKNWTTGDVYKEASYYYATSTTLQVADASGLADAVDAGDLFQVLCVGTDLTTSVDDLRRKLHHSHDRSYGEPLTLVAYLTGWTSEAGNSGAFVPSEIPGNYAPQYLHRDGFIAGVDQNLNDQNIMRGWLAFGVQGSSAGAHQSDRGSADTYGLLFSDGLNTAKIYQSSGGILTLDGGSRKIQATTVVAFDAGIVGSKGGVLGINPYIITAIGVSPFDGGTWWYYDIDLSSIFDGSELVYGANVLWRDASGSSTQWNFTNYSEGTTETHTNMRWDSSTRTLRVFVSTNGTGTVPALVDLRGVIWYVG